MAEITIKINVNEETDIPLLRQWLADGIALDTPLPHGHATGLSEMSLPTDSIEIAEAHAGNPIANGAADPTQQQTILSAPRRAGRRTNAEKAAERQAAELAQQQVAPPAPPVQQQDAPSVMTQAAEQPRMATPPGMALPPGIAMAQTQPQQQFALPQPQQIQTQPPQTAMPAANGEVMFDSNGVMLLESFREIYRQHQQTRAGKPMLIMKAAAWPDGAPKKPFFTVESIPEAERMRYVEEWATQA